MPGAVRVLEAERARHVRRRRVRRAAARRKSRIPARRRGRHLLHGHKHAVGALLHQVAGSIVPKSVRVGTRHGTAPERPRRVNPGVFDALVAFVALTGAAVAICVRAPHARAPARARLTLILIGLLALGSDLVRQGVYDAHIVSPQPIFVIAAGAIGGARDPAARARRRVAGVDLVRGELRRATLVNCGSMTLAALAGAGVIDLVDVGARPVVALGGRRRRRRSSTSSSRRRHRRRARGPVQRRALRAIVRDTILWMTPYYALFGTLAAGAAVGEARIGLARILVAAAPALAMSLSTRQYLRKTEGSMTRLHAANESLAALLDEKRGLLDRLEHHHVATIRGLARAIDAKDPYTAGHTERVARYCVTLAVEMGLDEPTVGEIEHGAILHDIGKIGVPDAVLTKPSALAPEEWAQMRRHPEIACEILTGLDLSQIAMDVIRSHHENVDGTGYPDGLAGSELSLPARHRARRRRVRCDDVRPALPRRHGAPRRGRRARALRRHPVQPRRRARDEAPGLARRARDARAAAAAPGELIRRPASADRSARAARGRARPRARRRPRAATPRHAGARRAGCRPAGRRA